MASHQPIESIELAGHGTKVTKVTKVDPVGHPTQQRIPCTERDSPQADLRFSRRGDDPHWSGPTNGEFNQMKPLLIRPNSKNNKFTHKKESRLMMLCYFTLSDSNCLKICEQAVGICILADLHLRFAGGNYQNL